MLIGQVSGSVDWRALPADQRRLLLQAKLERYGKMKGAYSEMKHHIAELARSGCACPRSWLPCLERLGIDVLCRRVRRPEKDMSAKREKLAMAHERVQLVRLPPASRG